MRAAFEWGNRPYKAGDSVEIRLRCAIIIDSNQRPNYRDAMHMRMMRLISNLARSLNRGRAAPGTVRAVRSANSCLSFVRYGFCWMVI